MKYKTAIVVVLFATSFVACTRDAPTSEAVLQVIKSMAPSDRVFKVTNLKFHCKITHNAEGQHLQMPMYAYTADVQAVKDGKAFAPPSKSGYLLFQKTEDGPWFAAWTTSDGWDCY